jgi:molecular chaperone HscB
VDHFEVFGLPRRLSIDAGDLQRRFYELSRRHHPDFHQGASADEQARALEASARVNAAYRALRDPLARIEYLVRLEEGRETKEGATVRPKAPPELLAEMFEIQEALQEAKAGGLDEEGRTRLAGERERLLARHQEEEARLCGPLADAWDSGDAAARARVVAEVKTALAARAYLRSVIDDLADAVGDRPGAAGDEEHVAHHRD